MWQYHQPDPEAPAWGYPSWNAWFVRRFKENMRPIDGKNDETVLIVPCEATPYALEHNVQLRSPAWLKCTQYSLESMLGDERYAKEFVGGSVYQAYLDAFCYHRWHSPVSGKVLSTTIIPGSYFALAEEQAVDHTGGCASQKFMTQHATRLVLVMSTECFGNIALVFVGMSECSSVRSLVSKGDQVKKGDDIGYFSLEVVPIVLLLGRELLLNGMRTPCLEKMLKCVM